MKLTIVNVDMDGYTGRDNHPLPADVGLVVIPVSMTTAFWHDEGGYSPVIAADGRLVADAVPYLTDSKAELLGNPDGTGIERMYTCVTPDGRLLDLMDHEIEWKL